MMIEEKIISKKLPVVPDLNLEFKPGYGLAEDILVNPDSVIAYGPLSVLKEMRELKTETKSFISLDSKLETTARISALSGFTYNADLINLTLDIQKIVDKQFDDIPVEVLDIPSDKEVLLLPNKIGISARGGIEVLGKLKQNQFRAYVHYGDVVLDTTGSVSPVIEKPENITIQFLKPERLRYIIKSF